MSSMRLSHIFLFSLTISTLVSTSCTFFSQEKNAKRKLASYDEDNFEIDEKWKDELEHQASLKKHKLEFPSGLTASEKTKLWHLAEGSEIYPTLWMMNLNSLTSRENKGTKFLDDLDKKYGVIKNYQDYNSGVPIKWIGLTTAWDGEDPKNQDIHLKSNESIFDLPKVKKLRNGQNSIAMSGVNCAFCHTAEIQMVNDQNVVEKKIIDGAPAIVDVRGFFQDLVGSTIKTMIEEKQLRIFLEKFQVENAEEVAEKFSADFQKDIGLKKSVFTSIIGLLEKELLIGDKVKRVKAQKIRKKLFEKQKVIAEYFIKLLQITHNLDVVPELIKRRMEYLASFGAPDPDLVITDAGYGRTDAFGRISNSVARGDNPIPLTAPVSLPFMYSIKYKAMFHYNGNTNSVVSRNVGQSFGLGAILTNPKASGSEKYSTTANIHNLIKLEKLLYKLQVPQLQKIFPSVAIDKNKVIKGCNIYLNKCATCHEAKADRVGPTAELINYKIIDQNIVQTDDIYLKNQSTPVNGVPFKKALFDFTDAVKFRYYEMNNVSSAEADEWANVRMRGSEVFRDTYLGETRFADDPKMNYVSTRKGKGYVANSLAGIWATAPYLHNGSIPNIEELLKPSHLRVQHFIVGNNQYDFNKLGFKSDLKDHPKIEHSKMLSFFQKPCKEFDPYCFDVNEYGNSNKGHEPQMYGGELRENEKKELIEFLKVLTPEAEYSWAEASIYRINNNTCELR